MSLETIAWHSYRGGVGKTLLSINSAVKLAQEGKKVMIIDYDLRAPSFRSYFSRGSQFLRLETRAKPFTEFLIDDVPIEDIIHRTNLNNLDCILTDIDVFHKTPQVSSKLTQHGEGKFLNKLFELIRYCNKNKYDYLFIDCMPGVTFRSLDALIASDKIFIIVRPVNSEIKGLELLISECYSKLEGTKIFALMNQVERVEDLKVRPNDQDIKLSANNIQEISDVLSKNLNIPIIHSFRRVPFVTERVYVLEDNRHAFSEDINEFCQNFFLKE
ncbi:MAG: ParA family protein [Candidatus Hodarchaeales archaeon]